MYTLSTCKLLGNEFDYKYILKALQTVYLKIFNILNWSDTVRPIRHSDSSVISDVSIKRRNSASNCSL
jgi:hypothetical protein